MQPKGQGHSKNQNDPGTKNMPSENILTGGNLVFGVCVGGGARVIEIIKDIADQEVYITIKSFLSHLWWPYFIRPT